MVCMWLSQPQADMKQTADFYALSYISDIFRGWCLSLTEESFPGSWCVLFQWSSLSHTLKGPGSESCDSIAEVILCYCLYFPSGYIKRIWLCNLTTHMMPPLLLRSICCPGGGPESKHRPLSAPQLPITEHTEGQMVDGGREGQDSFFC